MDAGYKNSATANQLLEDAVQPLFPYTRPKGRPSTKDMLYKREYIYDEFYDCYLCPENQELFYSVTNREGYREYRSDPSTYINCPCLARCTHSKTINTFYHDMYGRMIWKFVKIFV